MANKLIQEARDNSKQVQADIINVYNGIDEKRAREIIQERGLELRRELTLEALNIANSRISELENRLIPKMKAIEGAMQAFADPGFQILLTEAQKTAAASERPSDYELLSELLVDHFQNGNDRIVRAGVSRAVEIVDKISDDALLGLTVFYSVQKFVPVTGGVQQGLNVLNDFYGKLFYNELPVGNEWLDHLDILDAVRVSSFGSLYKLKKICSEDLSGYVDVGIEKRSERHNNAIDMLNKSNLPLSLLVDHELNDGYVRLAIPNKENIKSLVLVLKHRCDMDILITEKQPLTDAQKNTLFSIYDMYNNDENIKNQNVLKIMEKWDNLPNLKKLREWWDNMNGTVQLTSVGKVLAHSNAQRCYKDVPEFNSVQNY